MKATRGNIYSDDGSLLATSAPKYKVAFDPTRYWKYLHDKLNKDKTEKEIQTIYRDSLVVLAKKLADFYKDENFIFYQQAINDARRKNRLYMMINRQMISYHEKKEMESWPIFNQGRNKGGVIFEKHDFTWKS